MAGGRTGQTTREAVGRPAGHLRAPYARAPQRVWAARRAWVRRGTAVLLLSAGILWLRGPARAQDLPAPPDRGAPAGAEPARSGSWAGGLARFYRDTISAVDGDRCPSLPSCSAYSVQAFQKHGFWLGWLMTVDRLIHEADEGSVAPMVEVDGQTKIWDPVANNDFWWFKADAAD